MNPNAYIQLAVQVFQRNNPILDFIQRVKGLFHLLVNHQSNIKLNKFRQSLYMQQLSRMENFISQGSPYQYRGNKIDRKF